MPNQKSIGLALLAYRKQGKVDYYWQQESWLSLVQQNQDNGKTWGQAVKDANLTYPSVLLENAS